MASLSWSSLSLAMILLLSTIVEAVPTQASTTSWTSLGCYTDSTKARTLRTRPALSFSSMTVNTCQKACAAAGYTLAGLEFSGECWCDKSLRYGAKRSTGCSMKCSAKSEICGGSNRVSVYQLTITAKEWKPTGFVSDVVKARTLTKTFTSKVQEGYWGMTVGKCQAVCANAGYTVTGLEYGGECYCDNKYCHGGKAVKSGCNILCKGDKKEICGGPNRLSIYNLVKVVKPAPPPIVYISSTTKKASTSMKKTSTSTKTTASSSKTSTSSLSTTSTLPSEITTTSTTSEASTTTPCSTVTALATPAPVGARCSYGISADNLLYNGITPATSPYDCYAKCDAELKSSGYPACLAIVFKAGTCFFLGDQVRVNQVFSAGAVDSSFRAYDASCYTTTTCGDVSSTTTSEVISTSTSTVPEVTPCTPTFRPVSPPPTRLTCGKVLADSGQNLPWGYSGDSNGLKDCFDNCSRHPNHCKSFIQGNGLCRSLTEAESDMAVQDGSSGYQIWDEACFEYGCDEPTTATITSSSTSTTLTSTSCSPILALATPAPAGARCDVGVNPIDLDYAMVLDGISSVDQCYSECLDFHLESHGYAGCLAVVLLSAINRCYFIGDSSSADILYTHNTPSFNYRSYDAACWTTSCASESATS